MQVKKKIKYEVITKTCIICDKQFICKKVCLHTKLYCNDACAYVARSNRVKAYKIANIDRVKKQHRIAYWIKKDLKKFSTVKLLDKIN